MIFFYKIPVISTFRAKMFWFSAREGQEKFRIF